MRFNKNENIGSLRWPITLQQYSTSRDAYGQEIVTFSSLGTVWGEPERKTQSQSGEQVLSGEVTAVDVVNWRVRYRNDLTTKMRVIDEDGNIYDIQSILPDVFKQYMILETVNTGLGGVSPGAPEASPVYGGPFRQTFTNVSANAVTVTENEGTLPSNEDNILVFINGQFTEQYTVAGSVITFDFTIYSDDFVTVQFWT